LFRNKTSMYIEIAAKFDTSGKTAGPIKSSSLPRRPTAALRRLTFDGKLQLASAPLHVINGKLKMTAPADFLPQAFH